MQKVSSHGSFWSKDDLFAELVTKANKQADYDAIIANSSTMDCPVTGTTLYWKPEYSYQKTTEEVNEESRVRAVRADEIVKGEKGPSTKAKRRKLGKENEPDPEIEEPKALTDSHKKRMERLIPKMQQQVLELCTLINEAGDPANAGAIAPATIAKAKLSMEKGDAAANTLDAIFQAQKAVKGETHNAFATAKEAQDEMKALKDKLKADIDFAAIDAQ